MKKIIMLLMVVVMVVFLGTGNSFARINGGCNGNNGNGNNHHGIIFKFIKCVKKADISSETQETIMKLFIANKIAMKEIMDKMHDAMKIYMVIFTAPELDEAALAEAQANISTLSAEMLQLNFELAKAIRAALTPDELAAVTACLSGDNGNDDDGDNDDDDDDGDNDDDDGDNDDDDDDGNDDDDDGNNDDDDSNDDDGDSNNDNDDNGPVF